MFNKILFAIFITISCLFTQAFANETKEKTHQQHQTHAIQKKLLVTDKQLEEIIDKLSTTERNAIIKIQKEIAEWPKSIFEEISNYREFVMTARKIAIDKYNNMSPEARTALQKEKELKAQLTPATIQFLETIQLRSVQKTN